MTSRGLIDPQGSLVADASAVINLVASGAAHVILESLRVPLYVMSAVASELAAGKPRGWNSSERLATLVEAGLVEIVELNESSHECFESLVIGTAVNTLDDGEAATIAYARATEATALIDEKKAWRICASRFPELAVYATVELLTSAHVMKLLGQDGVADAVFNALTVGRMRVPAKDHRRVVAIVGTERAKLCTSLPDHIRFSRRKLAG